MLGFLKKKKEEHIFVSAIIAAGGSSSRMGGGNKMLAEISGMPVLGHVLTAFDQCPHIDEIIVVSREDMVVDYANMAAALGIAKLAHVVRGGKSRLESVYKGMAHVSPLARYVAVHDGARPCIRPDEITNVCKAAFDAGSAIAVAPVKDTLKRVNSGKIIATESREEIFAAQTPQVADRALLYSALQRAIDMSSQVTDEAMALELLGIMPAAVVLGGENIKITTPVDLLLAGLILDNRAFE